MYSIHRRLSLLLAALLLSLTSQAAWQRLMSEDFEGAFPRAGWNVYDANGGIDGEIHWGRDSIRSASGWYSAWCAAGGANGSTNADTYAPHMDAWMVYGPFSLADATAATLKFQSWLQAERGYDYLRWMASTDGINFRGYQSSTDTGGWQQRTLDLTTVPGLGDLTGAPRVWIAFVFESDGSIQNEGAYIDDITLDAYIPPAPPRLISAGTDLAPRATVPGTRLSITYEIENPGPSSLPLTLAMTLRAGNGATLSDPAHAITVHASPGRTRHTRSFDLPPNASGWHDAFWSLQADGEVVDALGREAFLHVNNPPTVSAFDIYDEPDGATLHPTKLYRIRARYRDAEGPDDLRTLWLRLRPGSYLAPTITFYHDTTTGSAGTWPGTAGGAYAQLVDIDRYRLHDGYEIAWTFRLGWAWPESTGIDVGIAAEDRSGLVTPWAFDWTGASFERDLRITASAISASQVEAGSTLTVSGRLGFAGDDDQPELRQGLGVAVRLGSPTGPLLTSAAAVADTVGLHWRPTAAHIGTHHIYVIATNAYHTSPLTDSYWWDRHTVTVLPDQTPPAAPALTSTTHPVPNTWYARDSIDLRWTPPADGSGIAGYSVAIEPGTEAIPGTTITTSFPRVTANNLADGIWSVGVRAVDTAGNWGPSATRRLRIDTTPPTNGTLRLAGGAVSTESLQITIDQLGAIDAGSGVTGLRLSNDGASWSSERTLTSSTPWQLAGPSGALHAGPRSVHVQYRDAAGNWSATTSASILYEPPPQSHHVVYQLSVRGARYGHDGGARNANGWLLLDLQSRAVTLVLRRQDGRAEIIDWSPLAEWYTTEVAPGTDYWFLNLVASDGDAFAYGQLYGSLYPRIDLGGEARGRVTARMVGLLRSGNDSHDSSFTMTQLTARIDVPATRRVNRENIAFASLVGRYAARLDAQPRLLPAGPPPALAEAGPVTLYSISESRVTAGGGAVETQPGGGYLLVDGASGAAAMVRAWREHGQLWYQVVRLDRPRTMAYDFPLNQVSIRLLGGIEAAATRRDYWLFYGATPTTAMPTQLVGERWGHLRDSSGWSYAQSALKGRLNPATAELQRLQLDLDAALDHVLATMVPSSFRAYPAQP